MEGRQRADLVRGQWRVSSSMKGMSGRGPIKAQVPSAAFRAQGHIHSLCWGWWRDTEHSVAILSPFGLSTLMFFGEVTCASLCMLKGLMHQGTCDPSCINWILCPGLDLNAIRPGHKNCLLIYSRDGALIRLSGNYCHLLTW